MSAPTTWSKTRARHLSVIQAAEREEDLPKALHVTGNSKTGRSVDFPVHATCNPTKVCMGGEGRTAACYAMSGFMGYNYVVIHQARNQRLAQHLATAPYSEVVRVVDTLYAELPRGTDWLRWNGAGDLTPGSVRIVNTFTRRHSDVALWVISRKPAMIKRLRDRASLRLLMSNDHSTPSKIAKRFRELQSRFVLGAARMAYTRVAEDDKPPDDTYVVFNKHQGGYYNDWRHPQVCPSSLSFTNHEEACDRCRHCFEPRGKP